MDIHKDTRKNKITHAMFLITPIAKTRARMLEVLSLAEEFSDDFIPESSRHGQLRELHSSSDLGTTDGGGGNLT
jgi:hypothetical protein